MPRVLGGSSGGGRFLIMGEVPLYWKVDYVWPYFQPAVGSPIPYATLQATRAYEKVMSPYAVKRIRHT